MIIGVRVRVYDTRYNCGKKNELVTRTDKFIYVHWRRSWCRWAPGKWCNACDENDEGGKWCNACDENDEGGKWCNACDENDEGDEERVDTFGISRVRYISVIAAIVYSHYYHENDKWYVIVVVIVISTCTFYVLCLHPYYGYNCIPMTNKIRINRRRDPVWGRG